MAEWSHGLHRDVGNESSVTQTSRIQTLTSTLFRLEMVVNFTGREGEAPAELLRFQLGRSLALPLFFM